MRGFSRRQRGQSIGAAVSPAYAGILPQARLRPASGGGLSRICGDSPHHHARSAAHKRTLPHMRGCSSYCEIQSLCFNEIPHMRGTSQHAYAKSVISITHPACAVILQARFRYYRNAALLSRKCGNSPFEIDAVELNTEPLPHMRVYSRHGFQHAYVKGFTPTNAVILPDETSLLGHLRISSHICGSTPPCLTSITSRARIHLASAGMLHPERGRPDESMCPSRMCGD